MNITTKISTLFAVVAAVFALAFVVNVTPAYAACTAEEQAAFSAIFTDPADVAAICAIVGSADAAPAMTGTSILGAYPGGVYKVGSTGSAVMSIQQCLNAAGFAAGSVDGSFGPMTKSAVISFQAVNSLTPDGVVGQNTWPILANSCKTGSPETPETPSTPSPLSGGEASLSDWDSSSEDDAEEGQTQHVATFEFDVDDADAMINRIDITFDNAGVGGTADDEPWDVFTEISLEVDGDEIASADLDDEDDWLEDDNPFVFRLNNVDYVAEEDSTVEIEVYLTAANNVDDPANADWEIYVDDEGLRYTDGAGITDTYGDSAESVAFGVDEEGGDESIEIKSSSNDPDAAVLKVDEDDESEWYEIFIFNLEAEENDIDLESLELTVTTGTANYEDVVDDIYLEIDGGEFDDVEVTDGNTTSADLVFDIDKDASVDGDDREEVTVVVKLKKQDGNYAATGETVQAEVTAVYGEGVDDVEDTTGLSGEEHELALAVAEIEVEDPTVDRAEDGDAGTISFQFTIDAADADDDVVLSVADNADVDGTTDDVRFNLSGTDTTIALASLTKLSGDAAYAGGDWTVLEGDEATFVLDVTFTTVDAADNGTYRVELESIEGQTFEIISSGMLLTF